MNKKRKILTLVALAAFGVIIMLRCSGWPAYHHSYWKNVNGFDLADKNVVPRTAPDPTQHGTITIKPDDIEAVLEPGYWKWERPPLRLNRDFHLSLFVLAVFYAGLFAVLGDNKRKEQ